MSPCTDQLDTKSQANSSTTIIAVVVASFVILLITVATVVIITAAIVHIKKHSDKDHASGDIPDHVYDTVASPATFSSCAVPASPEQEQAMKEVTCQDEQGPDDTVKYDDTTSVQKSIENRTEIELEINEAYASFKPDLDSETAL